MLFHLLLIASSPFLITAFPQNGASVGTNVMSQADGFIFDGPTAGNPFNGEQRTTSTSRTISTTTTLPEAEFNACVDSCPTTMEYNPVCGTDNADYTNPGGLGCAQRCGKEVLLRHYGRCSTGRAG